jgi:cytochrome c biogenesis protein CcmG, thiol:disulfide interchange protein DsbE
MIRRLVYILPVLGFLVVAGFLYFGLNKARYTPPDILPSVLINQPAPALALAPLNPDNPGFSRADLAAGKVTVVNFFASWCAPCRIEAPMLLQLSDNPEFRLVGVAYKDKRADTEAFLVEGGNPFAAIVADDEGRTAIDWGVTAAPETFVVDGKGVIRYRYQGALSPEVVRRELMPAIKAAQTP